MTSVRSWQCLALLLAQACAGSDPVIDLADPRLLRVDSLSALVTNEAGELGRLELQRYLTPADGPGALGRPVAAAVDPARDAVVVGDASTCALTFYSRQTAAPMQVIGRCGEGPGELRTIGLIVPAAESIAVVDYGARMFISLARTGTGGRREPMPPIAAGGWLTRVLGVEGDTIIGLWTRVGPSTVEPTVSPRLLRWSTADGTSLLEHLGDPPIADGNAELLIVGQHGCVQPHEPMRKPFVVVASSWMHEAVIVHASTPGATRAVTRVAWDTVVRPMPEQLPSTPFRLVMAICGDQSFAIYREALGRRADTVAARLEIRDYAGTLLAAREGMVGPEREMPIPLAMAGTTLYALVSDADGVPRLGEFTLGGN